MGSHDGVTNMECRRWPFHLEFCITPREATKFGSADLELPAWLLHGEQRGHA